MQINLGKIEGSEILASWFNPRDGKTAKIGTFKNKEVLSFDPPGNQKDGNDWVLILDKI
jgi:hypothetical protein